MPDKRISSLTELTSLADSDEFVVVDKSDTTMAASGTNKRMQKSSLVDTDDTLSGDSDAVVASQKATKAYADTKIPLDYLDTDGTLAADSDSRVATQKAVKTYSDSGTQTLINKTLTSPKLNEDVAVTLTATEANILHGKLGAWTSWTPSWTNLTVGNGSLDAKYAVIGKTIFFRLSLTFGSTTAITGGSVTFTLPSTIKGIATTNNVLVDASGGIYMASYFASGSSVEVVCSNASSTYLQVNAISSTIPFTFAATDSITVNGFYEAE